MTEHKFQCIGCNSPCKLIQETSVGGGTLCLPSVVKGMSCVYGDRGEAEWVYMGEVEEADLSEGSVSFDIDCDTTELLEKLNKAVIPNNQKALKPPRFTYKGVTYGVPTESFDGKPALYPECSFCRHPLKYVSPYKSVEDNCGCALNECSKCICHKRNAEALQEYLKTYEA